MKRLGYVFAAGYLLTIVGANWAITTFGIVPVGFGLKAPAGVYFAGLAFTMRDLRASRVGAAAAALVELVARSFVISCDTV